MKKFLSLLALTFLTAALSLSQTGCAGVYVTGPGPAYYSPSYPVTAWGGTGFYGGAAYYGRGWNNNYYNRYNSSGTAYGRRGGSASWGGGSGSWHGPRGGGGSWHR